jgi:hypothetical protein
MNINLCIKKDLNLKDECLCYLSCDLVSLFLIMDKIKKQIFREFNTQSIQSFTISRLSYDIFFFLNSFIRIILL